MTWPRRSTILLLDSAVIVCFKAVQWLCIEDMPLSIYKSLMTLLSDLNIRHIGGLCYSDRIGYRSYDTACEILHAMSTVIDEKIKEKLWASSVITILTDESTDIVIHHKLVISCRIVDSITIMWMMGEVRQQTITWANLVHDHCRHIWRH